MQAATSLWFSGGSRAMWALPNCRSRGMGSALRINGEVDLKMSELPKTSENFRDNSGRFAPGNPGKPFGARSRNKVSRDALSAVQGLSSLAVSKLRELVEAGEFQAIKLVIEMTVPKGGRTIELESANPATWADAMAAGEITPSEAATAANAMVKLNEAGEISDLMRRICDLEAVMIAVRP